MRTLVGMCLLSLSLVSSGHAQAQPTRDTVTIAANVARSVTISKAGVVLGVFSVPQGTLLSVTYDTARSILPTTDGRFEFHGDVEIRAQSASQRTRTVQLQDAMLQSPVLLTSKDVDVVIVRQP
jgi:hypothetical protein